MERQPPPLIQPDGATPEQIKKLEDAHAWVHGKGDLPATPKPDPSLSVQDPSLSFTDPRLDDKPSSYDDPAKYFEKHPEKVAKKVEWGTADMDEHVIHKKAMDNMAVTEAREEAEYEANRVRMNALHAEREREKAKKKSEENFRIGSKMQGKKYTPSKRYLGFSRHAAQRKKKKRSRHLKKRRSRSKSRCRRRRRRTSHRRASSGKKSRRSRKSKKSRRRSTRRRRKSCECN